MTPTSLLPWELQNIQLNVEKNLGKLKRNLTSLTFVHAQDLADRVFSRITHGCARVDHALLKVNEWAHVKVQDFHHKRKEKNELDLQMECMENEGGCPSGRPIQSAEGPLSAPTAMNCASSEAISQISAKPARNASE